MKHLIIVSLLVLIVYSVDAQAADKYVRKGASGTGTSWSDAWGDFNNVSWTGMSGSTLWIAAGSYTGGFPAIGVANVTIKRATVASHGSDTGWSSAYDGQVTDSPSSGTNFLIINSSNFTIDGAAWNPWKFRVVGVRGMNGMIQNNGADNTIIRGLEMDGMKESTPSGGPEDGLRWNGGANDIIEHCYIHDYAQTGGAHNDGVQGPSCTNITFRYNVFSNNGQQIFLGDYSWGSQSCDGISIHHNIFTNDTGGGSYNCIVFKGTNAGGTYTNKIENNTFDIKDGGTSFYLADSPSPGCCNGLTNSYVRNNIFYNSDPGDTSFYSHSNNLYYGGSALTETGRVTNDPLFTNPGSKIYTLQASSPAKDMGANLGYTSDIIGTSVQGSLPDMGAYEFIISGGTGSFRPGSPLRLR